MRRLALRTWRYFAEFSTEEHNWLVPDNVQEQPLKIAPRISPTNLAFLLNARQVACEMGYLTVPEFAWQTLKTLETMARMQTYRGHLLNWYDTRTLSPMAPRFVSTVDSGNLASALVALKNGTTALLGKPLLSPTLVDGYADYIGVLDELRQGSRKTLRVAPAASENAVAGAPARASLSGGVRRSTGKASAFLVRDRTRGPRGAQSGDDRRLHAVAVAAVRISLPRSGVRISERTAS